MSAPTPAGMAFDLYGEMGARFGRVHHVHLETNTTAEAIRYLRSQFPGINAEDYSPVSAGVGGGTLVPWNPKTPYEVAPWARP